MGHPFVNKWNKAQHQCISYDQVSTGWIRPWESSKDVRHVNYFHFPCSSLLSIICIVSVLIQSFRILLPLIDSFSRSAILNLRRRKKLKEKTLSSFYIQLPHSSETSQFGIRPFFWQNPTSSGLFYWWHDISLLSKWWKTPIIIGGNPKQ